MKKSEIDSMSWGEKLDIVDKLDIYSDDSHPVDVDDVLRTVPSDGSCKYLDDLLPGTIVAFRKPDLSVKSAKVLRKSTKDKKLMVQMKFGTNKIINFSDVIWVKTTERWPKWVFNLLKGIEDESIKAEA